jgi:hypothetical protein
VRGILVWLGAIALVLATGKVYGCTRYRDGRAAERADLVKQHQRELIDANAGFMETLDNVLSKARVDSARADSALAQVDARVRRRASAPKLAPTATPSDTAAHLRTKVTELEQDTTDLRQVIANQMRSMAVLLSHGDTAKARLGVTTEELEADIEREKDLHRFKLGLGLKLPKPPKWAAGVVGCGVAGTIAASLSPVETRLRNGVTACAAGAAVSAIVTPTD